MDFSAGSKAGDCCQACARTGRPLRSIFEFAREENSFADILDLIYSHCNAGRTITELSHKICYQCQEKAIIYLEFHCTVISTQKSLLETNLQDPIIEDVTESRLDDDFDYIETDALSKELKYDEEAFYEQPEQLDEQKEFIYCCNICESSFESEAELQHHSQLHEKAKSFPCSLCDQEFSTTDRLSRHAITHASSNNRSILLKTVPKQPKTVAKDKNHRFVCQICSGTYATRNILYHHLRKHTISREFACHLCPREFYFEKDLKVHVKQLHLERKRFACNECGSDYATTSALKKHAQTHRDNSRNFQCNECSMSFRTKGSLDVHSRIHDGSKPFVCSICPESKAFTQKIILQRHMKNVHNENIYKCDWCSESFEKHGRLRDHWKDCENFCNRHEAAVPVSDEDRSYQNEKAVQSIK